MQKIPLNELTRKLIHLSSLLYPALYFILNSREAMLFLTGSILLILLMVDITRLRHKKINDFFYTHLKFTLRSSEQHSITGSTYFMIGTFLTILLFPKHIAITSLCVLVLSDTFASIIGISFGKSKIADNKSLQGFLAFLASSCFISLFASFQFHIAIFPLLCGSIIAAILELYSKKLKCDDNILIPIGYGAITTLSLIIISI